MALKRLEDIQDGEAMEFLQVYIKKEPEIFCKRFREEKILEQSYSFLAEILNDLKLPYEFLSEETKVPKLEGENYSYAGMGKFAKKNGIVKIWKISGYAYNKRHLGKFQEKFPKIRFEDDLRVREGDGGGR
jgi:hypothetical protein